MSASLSVGTIVARIFPNGTRSFFSDKGHEGWPAVPDYPADLFAVAAYLLETAGAYHYLVPRDEPANWSASALLMDLDEHAEWVKSGQTWMGHAAVPELVTRLWSEIGKHAGDPVFVEHRPHAPPARWWLPAIGLLVIADEACADLGYGTTREVVPSGSAATSWVYDAWYSSQERIYQSLLEKAQAHITYFPQHSTVCMQADPDVVCVQPKSRTPPMGCTLRTFSHNLATLPPRGIVRACWQRPPGPLRSDDDDALNLLLIPYPFQISAQWFKGHVRLTPEDADRSGVTNTTPWGWFELQQQWLNGRRQPRGMTRRDALIAFTIKLIERSMEDVGHLHGVVFPELALDWPIYERIVEAVVTRFPSIEFLVAGSSMNCKGEVANVALSSVFKSSNPDWLARTITTSRSKHHRWRLDESQISTYALAAALDPRVTWWEKTMVPKREIHVNVFREASTFTTMICEDMARVDPCHTVLRSIGPSLVFALLMDGPQVPERWPARYATVLADDPGSSVLTFTSLALIERANRTGRKDGSRSVALWKEDTGRTVAIPCPDGHHGVVLTLSGYRTTEATFDGRQNRDGRAWRFHGQQPVKLRPTRPGDEAMIALVTGAT